MVTTNYNGYKVNLIESLSELWGLKDLFSREVMCGLDTETTGLSYNTDFIVGYCLSGGKSYSKDDYQGYYVPVRHIGYENNLDVADVNDFVQWMVDNRKVSLFNRSFDFSMMEKEGFVAPFVGHTHDVQILAHLATNESFPSLKTYVHNFLKMEVIEFASTVNGHNFGTTDPRISFVYAAQDPLVTVLLGRKLWTEYPYIRKVYPLDNQASEAVRHFCMTTTIPLDQEIIRRELQKTNYALQEVKNKIFSFVGYQFKLNSTRDKADALSRFVTLTQRTKKGQFEVGKEVLEKIDHPLAKMFLEYAKLEKFRGSYVQKMSEFPPEGIHINYSTVNVSTGRLSSGSSKGNDFFANFNIQNVPKVEVKKALWRDDELGYVLKDHTSFYVPGDGELRELIEIELEDGSSIRVDGEVSVLVLRDGIRTYTQVKNLKESDELLEV